MFGKHKYLMKITITTVVVLVISNILNIWFDNGIKCSDLLERDWLDQLDWTKIDLN